MELWDIDTIASHDRSLALAVCIHVSHIHGFCIFGSKLEDVSDLDTSGDLHGLFAAFRADAAFLDFCEIVILGVRNVALHVESFVISRMLMINTLSFSSAAILKSTRRSWSTSSASRFTQPDLTDTTSGTPTRSKMRSYAAWHFS